jgi:hypothetical protein
MRSSVRRGARLPYVQHLLPEMVFVVPVTVKVAGLVRDTAEVTAGVNQSAYRGAARVSGPPQGPKSR